MHTAYLLIGGNLGNRMEYLRQARNLSGQRAGTLLAASAIYETEAWGNIDQTSFLNQVITIRTHLPAGELMSVLLSIEEDMGRKRQERYGPRIIDIDILFVDAEIHHSSHITIPHPELPGRRFALVPLTDLCPNMVHPILKKTIKELLAECPDLLTVKKI